MAKIFKTNQSLIDAGFNQIAGNTLSLSGNTLIGSTATLKYSNDQSNTYTSRSVVDASYVTGKTSFIRNIGSNQQVIYRGVDGVTGATDFTYNIATSDVTIPNLIISVTPPNDTCLDYLLSWDDTSKQVHKIPYTVITGACNGLSFTNNAVCLGGGLCANTKISGSSNSFCINNENNNIVIDNRCNGGIYLKSQCGTVSYFSTFNNAVGIAIDYNTGFKIYDNRICQKGIEYNSNYSTSYTSRSLVDKEYVDAMASGIQVHTAVVAATTGDTQLSGLTPPVIIDGITLADGNRALIKDQINGEDNGIYVLSGTSTVFVRATDLDESSEVVHGVYVFVLSGNINGSTSWMLTTPNPITINVTPLTFTLFSQVSNIVAGTGITINVSGGAQAISISEEYQGLMASGGTYNLQSPAAICVGGICAGTILVGKTAFQLFEELLVPELFQTSVGTPTTTVELSNTGTYEIGCSLSQTVTPTYSQGAITPLYCSSSPYCRGGAANAYSYKGPSLSEGFSGCTSCVINPYIVTVGSNTWCVCTRYDEGACIRGSKNTVNSTYPTVCPLNSVTAVGSVAITGIYPYYYGKLTSGSRPSVTNSLVTGGTKVVGTSTSTVTVTFGSSSSEYTWLAIPSTSTSKICWYRTALDNGFMNRSCASDKYPDECIFSICSGQFCWTAVNYKVYMSGGVGEISTAMEFRNS